MLWFVMAILVADCVSIVVEALMCEGDKRRRMKKNVKEYLSERNMVVA